MYTLIGLNKVCMYVCIMRHVSNQYKAKQQLDQLGYLPLQDEL